MNTQTNMDKVRDFFFRNKVVLLFVIISLFAFRASQMTTVMFFNELFTRFGRNTFIVLSLLIPIVAGLGLNFGIVIGAMAAQIAIIFVVLWGGSGVWGLVAIVALATPIAILFGYLVGRMFNNMKGSEMIAGLVTGLFANGFYQFFFLFVMGGVIPITNERIMTGTGVGVLNAINLDTSPSYMRQAFDNVPMINILDIAFVAVLVYTVLLVIYKLVKKQPLQMFGPVGLIRTLAVLVPLALLFALSHISVQFHIFLSQNRLNGLLAWRLVAACAFLSLVAVMVQEKLIKKRPGMPGKHLLYAAIALAAFLVTWFSEINSGLTRVQIPVLTWLFIGGLCLFIKWFMSTQLGQNMRTVGQNRAVATAAGINVERTRIIAMIMSTVLAAYGHIISLQNIGVMNTYSSHEHVGLFAIAALLVGGATVNHASVKHALLGVVLFHSLFIVAPMAGTRLMDSALIGEYFRMFVAYAVIALALVMHAWKRTKKRKPSPAAEPSSAA